MSLDTNGLTMNYNTIDPNGGSVLMDAIRPSVLLARSAPILKLCIPNSPPSSAWKTCYGAAKDMEI